MNTAHFTSIQQLITGLSAIDRNHYRPTSDVRENVAEHSLSVATLAWFLHQHVKSTTNLSQVIKYALAHDFVEVYAGDVNTYATAPARSQKELSEAKALKRLASELDYFPDLVETLQAYQAMSDPEAKFVWAVDKIQARVLGQMDNWRCYREYPISKAQFQAKAAEHMERFPAELKEIFAKIVAWCEETY